MCARPGGSEEMCLVRVWILCVDGTSMYLCIVLDGYVRILGAPSV